MTPRDVSRVRVRNATARDHRAVREVLAAAYAQFKVEMPPEIFDGYMVNLLDLDERAATSQLLVAEIDGYIAGTATLYPDARDEGFDWPAGFAGVRAVAVDPSYRGRGVARRLMGECLNRAAALGATDLCLHTAHFMREAVALYEALRFKRVPDYDVEVGAVLDGVDAGGVRIVAYARPV